MEKIKCKCGGGLVKSQCEVEFFGIDFGIKKCEICRECNAEYLDNETMKGIENEVKKRGIFGLEKMVKVTKSGNSIVIPNAPVSAIRRYVLEAHSGCHAPMKPTPLGVGYKEHFIRIPPEIAKFSSIDYKSIIRIFPVSKNKIELEVAGK